MKGPLVQKAQRRPPVIIHPATCRNVRQPSAARQDEEKAFERLYAELDSFRREAQHLKPLYVDLILLHHRVEHILATQTDPSIVNLLGTIRDELLQVLYRPDVVPISNGTATIDSSIQQALGTKP